MKGSMFKMYCIKMSLIKKRTVVCFDWHDYATWMHKDTF